EILALEVLDQLVVRVVAVRRALQRLAPELQVFAEGWTLRGLLPRGGIVGEEGADLLQRVRFGVPHAAAGEAVAGLEVHVERGCGDLVAAFVEEARALPRLVRQLVVGEAGVAEDAEQRAAVLARVGAVVRADLRQRR